MTLGQAGVGAGVAARKDGAAGQAGRQALDAYLDGIAARDEAARRAEMAKIQTREDAVVRQQEVKAKLRELMGGGFVKTPLNARVTGVTRMEGFRIEKVVYESQPKFYVTALLYVPEGGGVRSTLSVDRSGTKNGERTTENAKLPAVVMAPGHAASGKAGDYAMAAAFARNGFVVLSYDPIGQGERLQYLDTKNAAKMTAGDPYPGVSLAQRATGEHGEAGLQPTLIGDAVARYFAWDGVRAVDYLASRPEVNAERIGAFGCSGGGAMTALLGASDKRVKAIATACYLTTMDELLPAIGPQDAEQSVPGFIASGFDFADWVEAAAPRAYAMVGTTGDMFPWKGFLETAREARRFYGLFDASAEGVGSSQLSVVSSQLPTPAALPTPTGPVLNPDTGNAVGEDSPFQVIAGVGGHGNLQPLTSHIVGFFLVHLAGRKAEEFVGGPEPTSQSRDVGHPQDGGKTVQEVGAGRAGSGSFDSGRGATSAQDDGSVRVPPAGALQVTATGQVATSYPGSETVYSLNLKRAKEKLPQLPVQTLLQVETDVREVTAAEAVPGMAGTATKVMLDSSLTADADGTTEIFGEHVTLHEKDGFDLAAVQVGHESKGAYPKGMLLLVPDLGIATPNGPPSHELLTRMLQLAHQGYNVLAVTPRPSPPGAEEIKSPILGTFYLTELRAELVGRTILGMRVDDVIAATDYLSHGVSTYPGGDPNNITVVASGHMGLVALHAAVLDSRIKHVTVDHVLESYRSLLEAPMPVDAPQDVLPGVLEKYDVPDLVRVLGTRVTVLDALQGTADLSAR
jgi:cephalosporin-C deacetylase-like acetyl esterase